MKKQKYLFILVGIALLIIGAFAIIGCNKDSNSKTDSLNKPTAQQKLISFSVISSANILGNSSHQLLSGEYESGGRMLLSGSNYVEPDMDKVNTYMSMMESMFNNGPVLVNEEVSDKEGYSVKQTYEFTDLKGSKTKYVMYLSETLTHKEEDEEEYSITGLAYVNDVEYQIEGNKEIEDELELEIKIQLDKQNYIIIETERESDESEYVYKVIKDGKLFSSLKFDDELYEGTTLKIFTNENGYLEIYMFIKENNKIKIEHSANNVKYTIYVTIYQNELGETIYEYKVKEKTYKYAK